MLRIAPVVAACLLVGCIGSRPDVVPAQEIRARLRMVSIGQSIAEVHEIIRAHAVRMPNNPDVSIPSPIRVVDFNGPAGRIRVEVYVVAVWRADGCPGFHYQDTPVAYLDEHVVSKQWDYLEWRWRGWGGSIAGLRSAQDRFACPAEPSASP